MNTHMDDPGIDELIHARVPLVVISTIDELPIPQVDIDNVAVAEMMEYFIGLGIEKSP